MEPGQLYFKHHSAQNERIWPFYSKVRLGKKKKTSGGDHEISLARMQSISQWALSKRTMVVMKTCADPLVFQLVVLFNAIINWR